VRENKLYSALRQMKMLGNGSMVETVCRRVRLTLDGEAVQRRFDRMYLQHGGRESGGHCSGEVRYL
jgi:hypothetical protein